jgi:hypothetical protein
MVVCLPSVPPKPLACLIFEKRKPLACLTGGRIWKGERCTSKKPKRFINTIVVATNWECKNLGSK